MRILIVASYNKGRFAPFITEQVDALQRLGVEFVFFGIRKKGFSGYCSELKRLRKKISESRPDLVHAHYGLSGLLANFQREVPVITTYHGSDINDSRVFFFSRIAVKLSACNIFVSQKNADRAKVRGEFAVIPCGVDLNVFSRIPRDEARKILGWGDSEKIVLFAGSFDNPVKNARLAIQSIQLLEGVRLIELKGFGRDDVALRMNAANALLMTSFSEGSPQVIKEAMACGCPVVSVDVGDVKDVFGGVSGCYVVDRRAESIADSLSFALQSGQKPNSGDSIETLGLSNEFVAEKILSVYKKVLAL